MTQDTLYLVTDQGPATGIGIYADALVRLLHSVLPEVRVFSACYFRVDSRPEWIRPAGAKIAKSLFEVPSVVRHNYRQIAKEIPNGSNVHFCGSSYGFVPHFPNSIVTIHDYYLRQPSFSNASNPSILARDLSGMWVYLTLPRRVRTAREIIVPTKHVQGSLKRAAGLSSSVIPHWVDLTRFHPRDMRGARETLGLPLKEKLILNVSQGTSNKNYSTLGKIATRLSPGYRMVKVGERIPKALGIVHFDAVPYELYPYFFNACDAYLHTSSQEGFGRPLIEAIASQLPIAALRTDVAEEVLGDAALYVDPHAPIERWIETIESLTIEETRVQALLRAKRVLTKFDPRVALNLYRTLYRRAFGY
jgi:glycosyltransferase involved in cell wall biosynthesis